MMGRFTKAYSSFNVRLREVIDLQKTAATREREDAIANKYHINALCRGSIVLLSAHLEGYVRDLGEIALDAIVTKRVDRSSMVPRLFYHISKPVLQEIKDTQNHDGIATKVFDFLLNDQDLWVQNGPFTRAIPADAFHKGFSNPAYSKIRSYLNRFGCDTYDRNLAQVLRADYQPVINMVDHLVMVRNKIAHGDANESKTPAELRDMIRIIRQFGAATDVVFASWCKGNLCVIR